MIPARRAMEGGVVHLGDGAGRLGALPVLRSARLTLKPVAADDAAAIRRLADDLDVARWMSRIPHPYGPADAAHFVGEIAPREAAWAIHLPEEGLVGVAGFAPRWHPSDMELGYWLGRPYWGRGLATVAAALMLEHAWAAGATAVRSGCFEGNGRSGRVLEKLGFAVVGRSTRPCLARGRELPHLDMRLVRPAATPG